METTELKAGIALDALIADKVMGKPLPHGVSPGKFLSLGGKLPPYSIDWGAAGMVVEKFRRGCNGRAAACVDLHVSDYPDIEDCSCKIYGPDTKEGFAVATEMPLAICLAALKAVGYK